MRRFLKFLVKNRKRFLSLLMVFVTFVSFYSTELIVCAEEISDASPDNIAHESKVGYTTLTQRVKTQILKDAELIKTEEINGAHWHFFTSGVTGKGGASQQLLDFLTENGIKYTIH